MLKDKLNRKKGQLIGPSNVLLVITVLTLIFSVVFFFLIRGIGHKQEVEVFEKESLKNQMTPSILAYLSTPVDVNINEKNQIMLMSDLIRIAESDPLYDSVLISKSREIFDKVYPNSYFVKVYAKRIMVFGPESYFTVSEEIRIPGNITITLYLKEFNP